MRIFVVFKLMKIYVIILLLMNLIMKKLTKEILEVNQLKDKNLNIAKNNFNV